MENFRLSSLPIIDLAPMLSRREVSPCEVIDDVLDRVEQLNPLLNAYVYIDPEMVRSQARQAEREITQGKYRGPLHSIPIAFKDNIQTAGVPTRAGSRVLGDFVPSEDATIVRQLRKAGAILIGKTNLSEFASGTETNNLRFGRTLNPWDMKRIPGGSSGGSAAATAAFMCSAAIGTDTGGSIRIPAALCGIVGLKPTFGRVSCRGVFPLAPSMDHVGPLARSVLDIALLLGAIAGYDRLDELSLRNPVPDYLLQIKQNSKQLTVGLPREFFFDKLDHEVHRAVKAAAATLEGCGIRLEEVSLPHVSESEEASTLLAYVEATSVHQSAGYFPSRSADYAPDVRARLQEGARVLATDYLKALAMRRQVRKNFHQALTLVDAILIPTVPIPAPGIEEETVTINSHNSAPVRSTLIRLNRPSNLTGLPAITVPCGMTSNGLPIGLQFIGRAFDEVTILRLAYIFEEATTWHLLRPPNL